MVYRRAVAFFVVAASLVTFACALVYLAVQQDLRSGANNPQFQLAEDAAAALDGGAAPQTLVGASKVDLGRSLSPFLIIVDTSGTVVASDAVLDGRVPVPPRGVLAQARDHPPDAVTWQPRAGVRIAQVSVPWRGGVVLAGRSLREVENRESQLPILVAAAWLAGLVGVAGASFVAAWAWPRPSA